MSASYAVRDRRAVRSLLVTTVLSLVVAALLVVATGTGSVPPSRSW